MRICVAGGGGFIGHHLARRLKKDGHVVIVADVRKGMLLVTEKLSFL
jgi:nucleoside-diphosphate-sugar epimerase